MRNWNAASVPLHSGIIGWFFYFPEVKNDLLALFVLPTER